MACGHQYDWRNCSAHGCCEVAACGPCNVEHHLVDRHKVIRWLHQERVRGCESCDNATEYEQGEQTPCDRVVCASCGVDVEPTTADHDHQLLVGA
jgi:hypothetical protein